MKTMTIGIFIAGQRTSNGYKCNISYKCNGSFEFCMCVMYVMMCPCVVNAIQAQVKYNCHSCTIQ